MLVFAAAKVGIFFDIKKKNSEIVFNKRCLPLRENKEKAWTPILSENKSTVYRVK